MKKVILQNAKLTLARFLLKSMHRLTVNANSLVFSNEITKNTNHTK